METTHEIEKLDISDTVAEITNVISKHLTKVIEKVSNKNIDASQNMEILNQLPIVKNLKKENESLQKKFEELQKKYKKTLEDLVQVRSKEKITMEITEIDTSSVTIPNISMEEIVNSIKKESKPITLWGIDDIDVSDEDEDAKFLSNGILNFNEEENKLNQQPKNSEVSAEDERLAIDNWCSFHENKGSVDCTKADNEILIDIMKSSAGIKGWAFTQQVKHQSKLTLDSFAALDNNEEEEDDEDDEDEEEEEEEDEDEEEEEDEEEKEDEEEVDEDVEENKEEEVVEEEEDEEEKEDEEEVDEDVEENKDEEEVVEEVVDEPTTYVKGALLAQNSNVDIIDDSSDDEDEEEIELEEYEHEGKMYYTEDLQKGNLYECLEDGEIGDIIGHLENGSVFFS
jgi:hypothetical protein